MPISEKSASAGSNTTAKSPAKDFSAKSSLPESVKKVSSEDAISRMKGIADGWKEEFKKLLEMPDELFCFNEGNLLLYSKDESLSAAKFLPYLSAGVEPPKNIPAYGIMIYDTSGSSYMVFVDTDRRVIVKDSIASFHSTTKNDWKNFMALVQEALEAADKEKSSLVVIDAVVGTKESY